MKYNTFLFRDHKNFVLVRPDPESGELDFQVVDEGVVADKELPANCVDAVEVTEPQEDVFEFKPLFRIGVFTPEDEQIDLAPLAEDDEDAFREIIDRLYNTVNHRCSMETK